MRKVEDRLGPYPKQEYEDFRKLDPTNMIEECMTNNQDLDRPGHPRFHEILDEMRDLYSKKNVDYAQGGQEGAHGNFIRVGKIKEMYPKFNWSSPFGVGMSYYLKQFDAVMHMYEQGKGSVVGEGIAERLMDMAVYASIMIILLQETEALVPSAPKVEEIISSPSAAG